MALPGFKKKKSSLGIPVKEQVSNSNRNFIIYLVIAAVIIGNIFMFIKLNEQISSRNNQDSLTVPEDSTVSSEDKLSQAERIITNFAKVYEIPQDEEPTVIAITDAEKLRINEPTFYANAKNGDIVVILYSKKLAFIFRESESKIVNVGFLSSEAGQ